MGDRGDAGAEREAVGSVSRRGLLSGGAAALGAGAGLSGPDLNAGRTRAQPAITTFEALTERARALAAAPYAPRPDDLPEPLRRLGYDGYQAIRPRPDRALRLGPRFSAQMFHRGFLHGKRADLFVQPREGGERPAAYASDLFDLGPALAGQSFPEALGFAGFRLHHGFDGPAEPARQEEFLVFLGASYFRLRGRHQEYGLSGRGIAIGTGLTDRPEEFPDFTTFWIAEPEEGEAAVTVMALLDGPSLCGAYRFRAEPGDPSRLGVEARLFPRAEKIPRLWLAPLTSMFLHGANGPARPDDFRPEVHDSDGLLFRTAEEGTSWRPLVNGRAVPRISGWPTRRVEGFALLQRERRFPAYLDVQARHEARPGLRVEPRGDWGAGEVQLFEIPSDEEYMDNIVAGFAPREPTARPLTVAYDLATVGAEPPGPLARVVSTTVGTPDRLRPLTPPQPGRRFYVVDFEGGALPARGDTPVAATAWASAGTVVEPVVERVPQTGGWRLYLEHRPTGEQAPAEIGAYLTLDGALLTEIWRYAA